MKSVFSKSVPTYASITIILATGILEFNSPPGVFLSWGYIVGMLLSLMSGKSRDVIISTTLSLLFVVSSFFRMEDQAQIEIFLLTRVYAVVGYVFISFFMLRYIKRESRADSEKSLMAGIFSHGTQGIVLTGITGDIVMVNPYIEELFGYNQNELRNQNIKLLLRGVTFSNKEFTSLSRTFASEVRRDVDAVKKNKEIFPAEISSNYYESSGHLYVATFVTDISIRKQNEQALLEQKNELEVVNQQLEAFSYSVSHDLRSPLRAVGGYATMLREDYGATLDTEANRLLNNIEESAQRMGCLIDDLLTFSRLGRKTIRTSEINMTEITTKALRDINKSYKNNADVTINPLHTVHADASLMGHVMTNLLSNALKYSSKNPQPKIVVSSHMEDFLIVFSVKDNGVGFDMNYAHKLFQVFQRLHLDSEFEGTGVGLAIAHRIVLRHGGKIWADSVENAGATFYFSLPAGVETKQQSSSTGGSLLENILNVPNGQPEIG